MGQHNSTNENDVKVIIKPKDLAKIAEGKSAEVKTVKKTTREVSDLDNLLSLIGGKPGTREPYQL